MINITNAGRINVKECLVAGGYKGITYMRCSKYYYDAYNGRTYKIEKIDFDREGSSKADIVFTDGKSPLRERALLGNLLGDPVFREERKE